MSTVDELIFALLDRAVDKIVVAVAGSPYKLTSNMAGCGFLQTALCIFRAVTIEAEVPGEVVFDGMGAQWIREDPVFRIISGGVAKLIGLNITGGDAGIRQAPT